MSEKKSNLKLYLLIFFIIEFVLAFFLSQELHIGTHPTTKNFSVWIQPKPEEKMQTMIAKEIQPDKYREETVREMADKLAADAITSLQSSFDAAMQSLQADEQEQLQALLDRYNNVGTPLATSETMTQEEYDTQHSSITEDFKTHQIAMQNDFNTQKKAIEAQYDNHPSILAFNDSFTYKSNALYKFFSKLFTEGSPYKIFGSTSAITNFHLWRMLLYLDIFIILLALYVHKKLSFIPSLIQIVFEFIYGFLEDLIIVTLGEKKAKTFIPFFVTLFFFIFFSNWSALLPIPGINEPTRNLNVPLGLGLMALCVVHFCSMKKKGVFNYIKGYCEPIVFMMPLNVIGEVSKIISISFRLFGNIFGGAIITIVVSALTMYVIVPVGLNMFFTMFAGTIQAFVFTMLSLTYLSLEIVD